MRIPNYTFVNPFYKFPYHFPGRPLFIPGAEKDFNNIFNVGKVQILSYEWGEIFPYQLMFEVNETLL